MVRLMALRLAKRLLLREFTKDTLIQHQAYVFSDPANFINFCTGKTKTDGLQIREGSCNGIGKSRYPIKDFVPV